MTGLTDGQIAGCFNRSLGRRYGVRLVGGAREPVYLPGNGGFAMIRYTRDYAASALHELAHWCIAGRKRRGLVDYGYWYQPPPRDPAAHEAFAAVETRVQALEARLADASGLPFRVSVDDVAGACERSEAFARRVRRHRLEHPEACLPPRARVLLSALRRLRSLTGGPPSTEAGLDHA